MRFHPRLWLYLSALLLLGAAAPPRPAVAPPPTTAPGTQPATQPEAVELSPLVAKLLDDPLTSAAQRRAMLIFHGQWEKLADPTPAERGAIALARFELRDPILSDPAVPALVRARAALWRGEPEQVAKLLEGDGSAPAAVVRAQALQDLGQTADAVALLAPIRATLRAEKMTAAPDLVAGAEALALLAQLEGRPAQDYTLAMDLLAKARTDLDRLYYPAALAEARLLYAKDNNPDAVAALRDVLRLNPRCGEAWYLLGRIAAENFDFERAGLCLAQLREANHDHLLAALLEPRILLTQKEPRAAQAALDPALARYPAQRELLALRAAAAALTYDEQATAAALDRFDQLAPGSPLALFTVGQVLSTARQYRQSETMLRAAIARQPNWPEPRVELGLMLMQAGDEPRAAVELRAAAALDPFNREAGNQLKLVEELSQYVELRTDHFRIRCQRGVDEVVARDMAGEVERIYSEVTGAFGHPLTRPAVIEILPDDQRFAVRITGLPELWTVAACTGDVIALTPPREGPHQRGPFDWARVLQHEFTHTVTLDQTAYRVPHWFTEACAVAQEPGGRTYDTCELLAAALQADKLFALDQINWGFVRPKTAADRPLAYAQAEWMLEYLTSAFGHDAVLKMLDLYKTGATETDAIRAATGRTPEQFTTEFRAWAKQQVSKWGLGPQAGDEDAKVKAVLEAEPPGAAALAAALKAYPNHPDLLKLAAQRALADADAEAARQAVLRYATARPVDPWADQMLVKLSLRTGRTEEGIGALEQLDRQETKSGDWAAQLAKLYRAAGQLDQAAAAARRALHREPYNPALRELAATLAVQRGDLPAALQQVQALVLLEPEQAVHYVRLAALYEKMEKKAEMKAAAEQARKLDPKVEVERFLK